MTHHSYCEFHLGDNLIHLHFLRRLAVRQPRDEFFHYVHECHVRQLSEAVSDIPNVQVVRLEEKAPQARNVWKNAGGYWERHPLRNDYSGFYLDWFRFLSAEMGVESPFQSWPDLLFDYPALMRVVPVLPRTFDFLVVNSQPCSGQFRAYDRLDCLDGLICELAQRYSVVCTQALQPATMERFLKEGWRFHRFLACTQDYNLTISQIGALSLGCKYIVMVSTGPSWPTFNVWTRAQIQFRVVMLDREVLNLSENTVQVNTVEGARQALVEKGLL